MPSKDSKTPEKNDVNVVKFTEKKGEGKSLTKKKPVVTPTKIITYVILGLLAIVLVFGVFPSFGAQRGTSSLIFGYYGKDPIEFAQGNYFSRQYQTEARNSTQTGEMGAYQVWKGAYDRTVYHTALSQMARSVGIRVTENTLNNAIIESGAYHKDGKFDIATYEKSSLESRNQTRTQILETLPVQMVLSDVASVLTSPYEVSYIQGMGNEARRFAYTIFDASLYPDNLTRAFYEANSSLFSLLDVSLITLASEDEAQRVRERIVSQEISFEDAAKEYSLDGFAAEGGRAGVWYLHELQTNFASSEEVNLLFSTAVGSISQVFASPGAYAIYRVEQAPFFADIQDPEVLAEIKGYIGNNNPELVTTFLNEKATAFASQVTQENFASEAEALGLQVVNVSATPANVGSQYLFSFDYTDSVGYLRFASQDTQVLRSLYTLPIGSITDPFTVQNAVVVAHIVAEEPMSQEMASYMEMLHAYVSQNQSQQDLVQAIFTSDKHKDNFLPTFFEYILGN